MKIENIIDDIKRDIIELSHKLEAQIRKENQGINLWVSLPGLEELATIKVMALTIEKDNTIAYLSVHIHTHNGNRVFENKCQQIINNGHIPYGGRHPFQDRFIDLLRDIIKKEKNKMRSVNKSAGFFNELKRYNNTV